MNIGSFIKNKEGEFHGHIKGLGIGITPVMLEPSQNKDGSSYYKVIADPINQGYEIGRAWERKKDRLTYYSVQLDSPIFTTPVNAALFPNKNIEDRYNLVWDRPGAIDLGANLNRKPPAPKLQSEQPIPA